MTEEENRYDITAQRLQEMMKKSDEEQAARQESRNKKLVSLDLSTYEKNHRGKLLVVPDEWDAMKHIQLKPRQFASYHLYCSYRFLNETQIIKQRTDKANWWNKRAQIAAAMQELRATRKELRPKAVLTIG